jgi:hypothetical protein
MFNYFSVFQQPDSVVRGDGKLLGTERKTVQLKVVRPQSCERINMNRIAEYRIESDTDLLQLENAVNILISRGFQPFGPLSTTYSPTKEKVCASQAMVKYAEPVQSQGGEPMMVSPG